MMRTGAIVVLGAVLLGGCSERDHGPLGPADPQLVRLPELHLEGGSGSGLGRPGAPSVPGEMVVRLADTITLPEFHANWGTTTIRELEGGAGYVQIALPDGESSWDLAFEMLNNGDCAIAEPNYELESPESHQGVVVFVEGGHVAGDVVDRTALARIGLPAASTMATGAGVLVAIVDTGVDASHPDLAGSVIAGYDFVDEDPDADDTADGVDQDGDGVVDEAWGHGTHVAGIIHAIAPDATLLPVRVLDSDGVGTTVTVARGIRWAMDQGADVINLSLGMNASADAIKRAVKDATDAGAVIFASTGNRGIEDGAHFPAKLSDLASVAATNAEDLRADFSSYASFVSVSAPGEGILSTYPGGQYGVWSGTSFSTPMVSAGAALWLELSPASDPQETIGAIENTASPLDFEGLPWDGKMGRGLLDLASLAGVVSTGSIPWSAEER